MKTGRFSVNNSVLINILLATILILGALSIARMPREQFSEVPFFWVNIVVPAPGLSAADIEKQILIPVEQEMKGLDRLKKVSSTARDGLGVVRVEFSDGISRSTFERFYQDARTRFGRVALPDEALQPVIDDFSSNDFLPVIEVVLYGDADYALLKDTARLLADDLLGVPQVSGIDTVGDRDREIIVSADRARMEALGISLDELVRSLRGQNVDFPAGKAGSENLEYQVRTVSAAGEVYDFGEIIIRRDPSGGVLHLGDIAQIDEVFDADGVRARYNGKPAIYLRVLKAPGGDSVAIIDGVKKTIEAGKASLGEGLTLELLNDSTIQIRRSTNVLVTNALMGFLLVVAVLYLFLGLRNALMTALGIPVTFALTFIILDFMGETFNSNTLFGLVLALGMIVDHGIVITENSHRLRQGGLSLRDSAIRGIDSIVVPVISATLTTVAAFVPLMLLPGTIGRFLRVIPLTVSIALLVSTLEAIVFVPAHFADWPGGKNPKGESPLFAGLKLRFRSLLEKVYPNKGWLVGGTFALMILSFGLAGTLKQDLFSGEDYTLFYIDIEMPAGTPLDKTERILAAYEERILPLVGKGEVTGVTSWAGFQTGSAANAAKPNIGQLVVDIGEREQGRKRPINAIMDDVRLATAGIAGPDRVEFRKIRSGPPVDPPVSFRLFGDSYQELSAVSGFIKERLAGYPELFNIRDNFEEGTPEIRIRINQERAAAYGLSSFSVGSYLRAGLDGIIATRFFRDNENIDVIVRFDRGERMTPEDLERFRFITPDGRSIPFSALCQVVYDSSPASIKRVDGKREITITAEAWDKKNIRAINKTVETEVERDFKFRYPGVSLVTGGEFAEFAGLLVRILQIFLIGIFFIYVILGAQFKSYTQPFLILLSVPLAFMGVLIYLFISRTPFSTTVLYAGVALAGISVNDSIVLIETINELRREGKTVREAILEATTLRFRPILLTSLTTIGGLLPTGLGIGGRSPVWQPMANTIVFGLFFSTVTALLFLPAFYGLIFDRNADSLKRYSNPFSRISAAMRKRSPSSPLG
jgi:multidrug efflux pump subunit AcrB